jgi:RNA polymerase sigma-70 factor (ECF subfamily)
MVDSMTTERTDVGPGARPDDQLAGLADDVLVRQLVVGSEAALGTLYDRHAATVYAAAYRSSGDPSIAAEVVQDTFLALWDRAETFDPARGSLRAWLRTVARNRTVDVLRAGARRRNPVPISALGSQLDSDDDGIDWLEASATMIGVGQSAPDPAEVAAEHETDDELDAALATLAPNERRVIALAYRSGLSQSEIAAATGWPIGTVKTRTRRGLRQLREWFEEPGLDRDDAEPLLPAAGLIQSAAILSGCAATPCS